MTHIILNVGGTRYETTTNTLSLCLGYFSSLFSGNWSENTDKSNEIFVDRDGKYFKYILDICRNGKKIIKFISKEYDEMVRILFEAEYFGLCEEYMNDIISVFNDIRPDITIMFNDIKKTIKVHFLMRCEYFKRKILEDYATDRISVDSNFRNTGFVLDSDYSNEFELLLNLLTKYGYMDSFKIPVKYDIRIDEQGVRGSRGDTYLLEEVSAYVDIATRRYNLIKTVGEKFGVLSEIIDIYETKYSEFCELVESVQETEDIKSVHEIKVMKCMVESPYFPGSSVYYKRMRQNMN